MIDNEVFVQCIMRLDPTARTSSDHDEEDDDNEPIRRLFRYLAAAGAAFAFTHCAHAALDAFACEPEWAALSKELGGAKVPVYQATTAMQEPHRIEARPSLIAHTRAVELLVCTGADLEVGWLPVLLQTSGNAKVQVGQAGYFMVSYFVAKLEVPKAVDRSQDDIHPYGNPHALLDPRNIARVAQELSQRLTQIDPRNAAVLRGAAAGYSRAQPPAGVCGRWPGQKRLLDFLYVP